MPSFHYRLLSLPAVTSRSPANWLFRVLLSDRRIEAVVSGFAVVECINSLLLPKQELFLRKFLRSRALSSTDLT